MLQEQMMLPAGALIQGRDGERYVVERLLGQGGFSAVYLVKDRRTKQHLYALKEMINPDMQGRSQMAFEAKLLMRLKHKSLPHVYQVFENLKLNRIYLLMDYIEGQDLEALAEQQPEQRFSLKLALALITPVVDAIHYLHHQEPPIVHRDIKPSNIIVPVKAGEAVLVDFGIAKEYGKDKLTNVFRYGSPGYAAPEQYGRGTSPRTDIYALGATFYTLLTGVLPTEALERSVHKGADPLVPVDQLCPAISLPVAQVIERAMSLHSEDRFATVDEFWRELNTAAGKPYKKRTSQAIANPAISKPKAKTPGVSNSKAELLRVAAASKAEPPSPSAATTQPRAESSNASVQPQADSQKSRSSTPVLVTSTERDTISRPPRQRQKIPLAGILILLLIGVVIVVAAFFADGFWSHPTPAPVARHGQATPAPRATATVPVASGYPQLASFYAGSINNRANTGGTPVPGSLLQLDLRNVKETPQGALSGTLQDPAESGHFSGTVSHGGVINFIVKFKLQGQDETRAFNGQLELDGIAGNYCTFSRAIPLGTDPTADICKSNQSAQDVDLSGNWFLTPSQS